MSSSLQNRISGLILGTAIGDSLGLPFEGISRVRAGKMFTGPLRHRFVFGRGMISDDTEHTFMVARSLLEESDSPEVFARKFAWRLRGWFLLLPAGVGMATAKACIKLLLGSSPKRSGVFSAGNGPAMRSAIFGAVFKDKEKRRKFVEAATRITHTDPKALAGALAIAEIAALAVSLSDTEKPTIAEIIALLESVEPKDDDWTKLLEIMRNSWEADLTVADFADKLGLQQGVGGYVYQTVPVAIYAWYRHYGDFSQTLESVIRCGGDTDTVGAIAGALAGVTVGDEKIPAEWIAGICEWPISVKVLRDHALRLAELLETGNSPGPGKYVWWLILPRNLLFLAIVLIHGFRRLAPPY